ncbi:nucleotide sugar dehydrogenase [Candidatus Dojkabacteria bacterium]|nr:nucleotide sugar dehydrogenase [Candidatus Dojkabacteria bacterium]
MSEKIGIVGLGYVGLPLAVALDKHYEVVGFDVSKEKIDAFQNGKDPMGEVDEVVMSSVRMSFSTDPSMLRECTFIICCVPTPVDKAKKPDFRFLESASIIVGKNLSKNAVVVFESTVYPGVTEEVCVPIIEKESGLKCGLDFKIAYSPERINPADKEHTIDKIAKVVSGMDTETLERVDAVYSKITVTHKAPTIKVAEAAKVIENVQRDLNIALMNELKILFDKMDINIYDVLQAAGTKWNFHKYSPGMVGGHCIPVDPYYLTYKAEMLGYHPQVILAGRRINDNMHKYYAEKIIKRLIRDGVTIRGAKVLVAGLTFKPNVPDARNTRVKNLVEELREYGVQIAVHDPFLTDGEVRKIFSLTNGDLGDISQQDLIVKAVNHEMFSTLEGPNVIHLSEI